MRITATYFNLYNVCKRELWLHANEIRMEFTSDIVYQGKLIHETAYPQRSDKYQEVQIGDVKIDYYDKKNKVIHEIKKSDKVDKAHEAQLKYYIYIFEQNGINGVSGLLEYPKLRKTKKIILSSTDISDIQRIEKEISNIIGSENCPPLERKVICKKCSYYDFCYSGESDDNQVNGL
ncbi:MAG: CRISPR-associated protein Cas4 [Bacteroidales bacterium]|jgi:CRISPR-associated exonuclease Cas4|nr:CRISPR-associated protein Cas4 [Bacteroidales bacterium]